MCDACAPSGNRLKLADIDGGWYCTIIGTCLGMAELRSLAVKLGVRFHKPDPSDYEVHTAIIRLAKQERPLAKALTKLLDRKHAAWVSRFKKAATTEAVEALWRDALDKGEVAGACWALMSHPAASETLRGRIFGEIHMLSHQLGATARADLRRLHALTADKAALEDQVARRHDRLLNEIASRDAALRDLAQRLDQEIAAGRRLSHAAAAAAELDELRATVSAMQRHLAAESDARRSAETAARDARLALAAQAERAVAAQSEAEEARAEIAALEARLAGDGIAGCDRSCGRPDLCGRCILYVGGRAGLVPHLRRLVEQCNGTFVHHDGGFEENMGRLGGLLGQADTVMFPVDCVSHMAHDQLKRLCKRMAKPFVPVRRSGLGAFARALERVGSA